MARATLKLNGYDNFEKLLNRFKKSVERDNVLRDYQEKMEYEKPTTKRKKAKALAVKRHQKQLRDENTALDELRSQARPSVDR